MTPAEMRALDARVAEEVMGWEWCDVRLRGQTNRIRVLLPPGNAFWRADGAHDAHDFNAVLRPFSTDIAAAWTVVEKMHEWGWEPSVVSLGAGHGWRCDVFFDRDKPHAMGHAATPGLAIALAALRAKEEG